MGTVPEPNGFLRRRSNTLTFGNFASAMPTPNLMCLFEGIPLIGFKPGAGFFVILRLHARGGDHVALTGAQLRPCVRSPTKRGRLHHWRWRLYGSLVSAPEH